MLPSHALTDEVLHRLACTWRPFEMRLDAGIPGPGDVTETVMTRLRHVTVT